MRHLGLDLVYTGALCNGTSARYDYEVVQVPCKTDCSRQLANVTQATPNLKRTHGPSKYITYEYDHHYCPLIAPKCWLIDVD